MRYKQNQTKSHQQNKKIRLSCTQRENSQISSEAEANKGQDNRKMSLKSEEDDLNAVQTIEKIHQLDVGMQIVQNDTFDKIDSNLAHAKKQREELKVFHEKALLNKDEFMSKDTFTSFKQNQNQTNNRQKCSLTQKIDQHSRRLTNKSNTSLDENPEHQDPKTHLIGELARYRNNSAGNSSLESGEEIKQQSKQKSTNEKEKSNKISDDITLSPGHHKTSQSDYFKESMTNRVGQERGLQDPLILMEQSHYEISKKNGKSEMITSINESESSSTRTRDANQEEEKKVEYTIDIDPEKKRELEKWRDTGLEEDFVREYLNPVERKMQQKKSKKQQKVKKEANATTGIKQPKIITGPSFANISQTSNLQNHLNIESTLVQKEPLFQKSTQPSSQSTSYLTLDGPVRCDSNLGKEYHYQSISDQMRITKQNNRIKDLTKNKIQTPSRFFSLKNAQNLPSHYSQNRDSQIQEHSAAKNVLNEQLGRSQKLQPGVKYYSTTFQGQTLSGLCMNEVSEQSFQGRKKKQQIQSQNLSQFGKLTQQNQNQSLSKIPLVKQWFESLDLNERVLSVSTVDSKMTQTIKVMHHKLRKVTNSESGKFRMISTQPTTVTQFQVMSRNMTVKEKNQADQEWKEGEKEQMKINYTMSLCNTQAHRSSPEVTMAELEFLDYVRFTDSFEMHDTLTVQEDLVREPERFYRLAERIVGSNYLKQPHEIRWLEDGQYVFESCAPLWLDMHQPNSLAAWILYYIERALFIQYEQNVKAKFLHCRDQNKQSIFLNPEGKNIILKDELKPFWRTFCEENQKGVEKPAAVKEFLEQIKQKAMSEFGIDQNAKSPQSIETGVDAFNGGLTLHSVDQQDRIIILEKIDRFINKIDQSIENYSKEVQNEKVKVIQLDLRALCMNSIRESSSLQSLDFRQVAKEYSFESQSSQAPLTNSVNKSLNPTLKMLENHIDIKLERIFIAKFRNYINLKLKSQYTTTNKKLQKRKIKKLKQKELEKERERESVKQQEAQEVAQEEPKNEIHVKTKNAVELLMGSQFDEKEIDQKLNKDDFEQKKDEFNNIKQSKKNKNRKGKKKLQGKVEEEPKVSEQANKTTQNNTNLNVYCNKDIDLQKLPQKPSTPKELQQKPQTVSKIDPQNYFQVFGHKYAASLESQDQIQRQREQFSKSLHSDISGNGNQNLTNQGYNGVESSTNCGTISSKTLIDKKQGYLISQSDNSHKSLNQNNQTVDKKQKIPQHLQLQVEEAMSNQEILNLMAQCEGGKRSCQGSSHIHNKQWQRGQNPVDTNKNAESNIQNNQRQIRDLISDLISETSSHQEVQEEQKEKKFQTIDVRVKEGKLHVHKNYIDDEFDYSDCDQSQQGSIEITSPAHSNDSPILKNQIKRIGYKAQNNVSSSSDSESASDSEQDLLPDVYNYIPQPEDNDSSDYGAEEGDLNKGIEENESDVEGSSDSSSQSQQTSTNKKYEKSHGNLDERPNMSPDNLQFRKKKKSKIASFKTTKQLSQAEESDAANKSHLIQQDDQVSKPKGATIDFYRDPSCGEKHLSKGKGQKKKKKGKNTTDVSIVTISPVTCQRIFMSKEIDTEYELKSKAKANKKNKKQKKLDWQLKYGDLADVQPDKIEIIKPAPPTLSKNDQTSKGANVGNQSQNETKEKNKKPKKSAAKSGPTMTPQEAMNNMIINTQTKPKTTQPKEPKEKQIQINTNEKAKNVEKRKKEGQLESEKDSKIKPTNLNKKMSQQIGQDTACQGSPAKKQAPSGQNMSVPKPNLCHQPTHQNNPQQRLSMMEEAKALSTGYQYQAKKVQTGQKVSQSTAVVKDTAGQTGDNSSDISKDVKGIPPKQARDNTVVSSQGKIESNKGDKHKTQHVSFNPKITSLSDAIENLNPQATATSNEAVSYKKQTSPVRNSNKSEAKSHEATQAQITSSTTRQQQNSQHTSQINSGQASGGNQLHPPEKKKNKKSSKRSSKKKNKQPVQQINNYMMDHSQQQSQNQYMDFGMGIPSDPNSLQMQAKALAGNDASHFTGFQQQLANGGIYPQNTLNLGNMGSLQGLTLNQQFQELLYQLNEQMIAQQQQQLQEMQLRQQNEVDNMIQEECEPCQEIDSAKYEQFFDELEQDMIYKVKEIDQLKDSVRKERQGFISIVESIVKDTFSNRYGNGFVGIKIFGSMATELAIETSDVDLVVTGITSFQQHGHGSYGNYGREQYSGKNQLLKMMQKLYDNLQFLKEQSQIYKMQFIQGANVPIIKLVVDLQAINKRQIQKAICDIKREREEMKKQELEECGLIDQEIPKSDEIDFSQLGLQAKNIDQKMRYLKVDISIDEQSHQYLRYDTKMPRNHSGIDTIYHIQGLVRQRKDLRPIVMIIKKIFDETFLSMPYYGGISSYSLVLMVSAYLKRFDPEKQESLSRNLSGFFHFYGVGFKPHLFYLNGDQIEFCDDPSQRPFTDPFIVLDPMDTSNNISHSTFRIRDIQRALVQAFKIINQSCEKFQNSHLGQESMNTESYLPKNVLNNLVSNIKKDYYVKQMYDDDDDESEI